MAQLIVGHDDALPRVQQRAWRWALKYPHLQGQDIQDTIDVLHTAWLASIALDPATIIAALKKTRRKK